MPVKEEKEEKGDCLMGSSSTSTSNKRQRFYVQLKPGETAIVSWKKLLRDACEIDQCPPPVNAKDQSFSAFKTLDDNSNVGKRNNSFLSDERLGQRTKARLSDNLQLMVPKIEMPIVEPKTNDDLTRKLEDRKRAYRLAVENTCSMFQKYLCRSDTTPVVKDRPLEGLHDVPVMYSHKYSSYCGKLNWSSPKNVAKGTLFPLKTKCDILQKNRKLCSEKSRINMKAANESSDIMSQISARGSSPLRTCQRSRNSVDGYCGKLNRSLPKNVAEGTLFPLKSKRDILQKTQKVCSEKSRINMKAANESSDIMSQSSARRSSPLRTYQRSRNLVDGRKSKLQSMVQNDNLVGLTTETNVTRNPDTASCLKRKITDTWDHRTLNPSPCGEVAHKKVALTCPSLLPKTSYYAQSVKFKSSREQPLLKEPKMEFPGKPNVKIRFHLKPEHQTRPLNPRIEQTE